MIEEDKDIPVLTDVVELDIEILVYDGVEWVIDNE